MTASTPQLALVELVDEVWIDPAAVIAVTGYAPTVTQLYLSGSGPIEVRLPLGDVVSQLKRLVKK